MVAKMNTLFSNAGYTVRQYAADSEIDTIVRDQNYGTDYPYFCFGLSFENTAGAYKYNLRFNLSNSAGSTEGPAPSSDVTTKRKLNLGTYAATLKSGMIGITNIVNNAILQTETANTNMLVNKEGPIYQEAFINDPIYTYLANSA